MCDFSEKPNSLPRILYYRITGPQSIERLQPLLVQIALGTKGLIRFEYMYEQGKDHEINGDITLSFVWETTVERRLQDAHARALVRNKLLNSTILESKANFAFLQVLLPLKFIPKTFVARNRVEVEEWADRHWSIRDDSIDATVSDEDWWVVKASAGNGGKDVWIFNYHERLSVIKQIPEHQEYVIQKYVERPMLFKGKKFHFRCYSLLSAKTLGVLDAFVYQKAFILTAGYDYTVIDTDSRRHITNLSVNKHLPNHPGQIPCHIPIEYPELYPKIKEIWNDVARVTAPYLLQPNSSNCFEFFGLDIIADEDGRCWLIEVNRLPGLESSKNNQIEEDEMYDQMMVGVLKMTLDPILTSEGREYLDIKDIGLWDCVEQARDEASASDEKLRNSDSNQLLIRNMLKFKALTRSSRQQILASFNS